MLVGIEHPTFIKDGWFGIRTGAFGRIEVRKLISTSLSDNLTLLNDKVKKT